MQHNLHFTKKNGHIHNFKQPKRLRFSFQGKVFFSHYHFALDISEDASHGPLVFSSEHADPIWLFHGPHKFSPNLFGFLAAFFSFLIEQ